MTFREPIELCQHSPEWAQEFAEIGRTIRHSLGPIALRIDHIGSTSIPRLDAKPIIDIQISVAALEPIKSFQRPLEQLGYRWRSDNPDKTKRYFRETPPMRRTHIHVRKLGSWHQQAPLLFRDYLRVHRSDCEKYGAVKRELARRFHHDRKQYTSSKSDIVWEILERADRWAASLGWEPGTSDV